jgi:2-keto-4-pentenoate hydratase/2-oxohepta-3-ene-1,7-dioic acid hydratase in catechol pathway
LHVNGVVRQQGDSALMLNSIPALIAYLSTVFTLDRGDIIYTGTPEGVGQLASGDTLDIELEGKVKAAFAVA